MCVHGVTRVKSGWILCSIKGKADQEEITATTIFVDHCSDFECIHFTTVMTSEETLYAKELSSA